LAIDEFDPLFLTDLVGHIYEAAVDVEHWDEFLAALERIYPGSRVTLFGHENGRPVEGMTRYRNFGADDLKAYVDYYVGNSPYISKGRNLPVGQPVHYESFVQERDLLATEHYNDFVRPRRLGYWGTGAVVERTATRATALSLADHKNDPGRRARQLRLIDLLVPHIARALRLHRAVVAQKIKADATSSALDRWSHAAIVLDRAARVVAMNAAAEALVKRSDGLCVGRNGQLRSADESKTAALELAARKCAAPTINPDARLHVPLADLDRIALPRPSGASPLRVMISPLPFLSRSTLPGLEPGTVLLVIFDPDDIQRTPVDWIARQFGLTPSEQRLTEAIVNGVPLAEAAEELGIRLSTARTRLKTIQAKTHCHRQVDLVRLALSLPAVRQD
jgi:DNA-binding CsgD family transcriptional regulator